MRNIALGRGSTTRPSTSMAPSFFAITSAILALPATSARAKSEAASTLGAASAPATKREHDLGNSENSHDSGHTTAGAGAAPLLHDTRFTGANQNDSGRRRTL